MKTVLHALISLFLLNTILYPSEAYSTSESIGFYTAGCIRNSQMLQDTGDGYQVIRLSRERFYGHPKLVEFIKYLGKHTSAKLNSTLLIGDMSQSTGGPLPSDHTSHQTGLDVDIMYQNQPYLNYTLSKSEREDINPISVLNAHKTAIKEGMWEKKQTAVLVLATAHPDVERIFVNPVIKLHLCNDHKGQPWLNKIRPWYGHDGHFHVRLKCPNGSKFCENQKAIEPGDGCGEDLKQWFIPPEEKPQSTPKPKKIRQMPEQCMEILSNQQGNNQDIESVTGEAESY
ncbi:MAG: penicillin-insensitive murein endopeptidase [Candidatus Dadabacteria bacterium]|nr:penicillin-insensitive murein endopeptidase [Candidatus Dadabacteria bacterium]NIV41723.1 penicillin-insensitive murein endopeptidase [Candidatus Dadabacteria bacterium]NIX15187.1 penicillin-insensitive murein endopeptidase [Candidatus Dadabacteria bacterium]